MKQILSPLFIALTLAACASPASVSSPQTSVSDLAATIVAETMQALSTSTPEPTDAPSCPETREGTHLLTREEMGYCLLYPEGYIEVDTDPTQVCLVPDKPFMACHTANAFINVESAAGRSAQQIADEMIAQVPTVEPSSLTIGGKEAVVLDGLGAVAADRQIVVVHADRLYTLTFVPWDESAEEWVRVETLYHTIVNSFGFLPTPAWTLPDAQQLLVSADVEGIKFTADASGMYRFKIISGSYSVCPGDGTNPPCGKWRKEIVAYVNRDIVWSVAADGSFRPDAPDFSLGGWLDFDTPDEAESHSGGSYPVALREGDFVWLLAPDKRDAYDDNLGAMTVSISMMAPLP